MNQLTNKQYARISAGCNTRSVGEIRWATSPMLESQQLVHGFSQRTGGVSGGAFASLNLGLNRPEPMETIMTNYRRMCDAIGVSLDRLALCAYCHGDGVEVATKAHCGYGFGKGEFAPCDALVSDQKDVVLVTLHADCMPVILHDPVRGAAGTVHAGWKGASLCVGAKASRKMQSQLGCDAQNIFAWIGPSICQEKFEVDADVMRIFADKFGSDCVKKGVAEKYHVDLWRVMVQQLWDSGIPLQNIQLAQVCTYENEQAYFSYRRDRRVSGAMAAFVKL